MTLKSKSKRITKQATQRAVEKWLRTIPDDSFATADDNSVTGDDNTESSEFGELDCVSLTALNVTEKDAGDVNGSLSGNMFLKGSGCVISTFKKPNPAKDIENVQNENNKPIFQIPCDNATKRVTFQTNELDNGTKTNCIENHIKDVEELRKNMALFLRDAAWRKEIGNAKCSMTSISRAEAYLIENSDTGLDNYSTVGSTTKQISKKQGISRRQPTDAISPTKHVEFDDLMFDRQSLRTASSGKSRQTIKSEDIDIHDAFLPSRRRACKPPRAPRHETSRGTFEAKAPRIRGLVVDKATNQKPSVVRASQTANVREEFALKQRVLGYKNECHDSISHINLERRRLSANLIHLKHKMAVMAAARARADEYNESKAEVPLSSEELFLRSKGYVPDSPTREASYCFPPLIYPKRKQLTITSS